MRKATISTEGGSPWRIRKAKRRDGTIEERPETLTSCSFFDRFTKDLAIRSRRGRPGDTGLKQRSRKGKEEIELEGRRSTSEGHSLPLRSRTQQRRSPASLLKEAQRAAPLPLTQPAPQNLLPLHTRTSLWGPFRLQSKRKKSKISGCVRHGHIGFYSEGREGGDQTTVRVSNGTRIFYQGFGWRVVPHSHIAPALGRVTKIATGNHPPSELWDWDGRSPPLAMRYSTAMALGGRRLNDSWQCVLFIFW